MFRHGNIREFSRNNQRKIKYKNLICLSNFPFNYLLNHGTCPSTQHLCFKVTANYTFCNAHECFCGKSSMPMGGGRRKAIQSVITDFKRHNMCMPLICGHETLTDLTKLVILRRKFR